ncbi:hypothetical protein CesoFtcFv8_019165 [Champsocephalus esox]|uniref:Uncharacterized protein n=1 Tax=Champsocephalus esox TaxID=159716 RepID=A0AAN8BI80_9TELE|nr:hypothetical protein CesoFtcFv8_019165 [Champsocephalus esox]
MTSPYPQRHPEYCWTQEVRYQHWNVNTTTTPPSPPSPSEQHPPHPHPQSSTLPTLTLRAAPSPPSPSEQHPPHPHPQSSTLPTPPDLPSLSSTRTPFFSFTSSSSMTDDSIKSMKTW